MSDRRPEDERFLLDGRDLGIITDCDDSGEVIEFIETKRLPPGDLYLWNGEWELNPLTSGRFNQPEMVKVERT